MCPPIGWGIFGCVFMYVWPLLMDLSGTKLCIRLRYNENHSNEISIFSSRGVLGETLGIDLRVRL